MDCDESSISAPITMLPKEMLEQIFERLPFRDLLTCRKVNSTWKKAATHPLRKKCAPLDFSLRRHLPYEHRGRSRGGSEWVIKNFMHLIRGTDEQGGLDDFPVTEFKLNLNSKFYWLEMEGCAIICHLLEAVSPFVKEINFDVVGDLRQVPNSTITILQGLTFPNLTKVILKKNLCQHNHTGIFSVISNVLEKSPNIKQLIPFVNDDGDILQCFEETGILQRASLVASLIIKSGSNGYDLKRLSELEAGFKLTHLVLKDLWFEAESLNTFLKSQSDTLTYLAVKYNYRRYHDFRELPCLPHLKNFFILSYIHDRVFKYPQPLPTSFYKETLPALKTIGLQGSYAADYFMASHLAPSESLQEISIGGGDKLFQQAARVFPNLKKIQLLHGIAKSSMRYICENLPGIEELCIVADYNVDDVITGLSKEEVLGAPWWMAMETPRPTYLSKAVAILKRRGPTKTLAGLENLKTLVVIRDDDQEGDFTRRELLTEISGVVLKQMKSLQRIEFGIRNYMPIDNDLRQDLESHGIQLFWKTPPRTHWRTYFFGDESINFE